MAPDPPPSSKAASAMAEEPPEYDGIAANAVFNTAELIEKILVDVPFKTLLTSQRVSKQWKAAIAGSKEIRKKLFLKPAVAKRAFRRFQYLQHEDGDEGEDPMRVIRAFDGRASAVESIPIESVGPGEAYALQASLNPLFRDPFNSKVAPYQRADSGEFVSIDDEALLRLIVHTEEESIPTRFTKSKPSYLEMFLCQPPSKAVDLRLRCVDRDVTIRSETGVRIRHIVGACFKMKASALRADDDSDEDLSSTLTLGFDYLVITFAGLNTFRRYDKAPRGLGQALLFCSPDDKGVEDPLLKKGVTYDVDDDDD